jgi:hypothetical protein
MKNYIELWAENLKRRKSFQLNGSFEIVGERNAHLGGRCEIATIRLTVRPAESFQVYADELSNLKEVEENGYLDAAVFGILDILIVGESHPLTEVAILFQSMDIHPIESSASAFRQAGRDAGRKILAAMKKNMFKPPA